MNPYGYVWEKFFQALCGLVTTSSGFDERLRNAYQLHLMHAERSGLPDDICEDFQVLRSAVDSDFPIDESKGYELLPLIVTMYDRVAKYGPYGHEGDVQKLRSANSTVDASRMGTHRVELLTDGTLIVNDHIAIPLEDADIGGSSDSA